MRLRRGFVVFISIIQIVFFLTHLLLYKTWTFANPETHHRRAWLISALALLSVSFVGASLLAFRYKNAVVRAIYKAAAIWAGYLSFLTFAAFFAWIVFALAQMAGVRVNAHETVTVLFGAAGLLATIALINAGWTRITRLTIRLANLPPAWRGRKAALLSDVHLGHVRNYGFLRRLVAKITREAPDAVFIAGDLYDGTAIDPAHAAHPLSGLSAPHGVYFVAGNHEQFGDDSKYLNAIAATGVRVLTNEKVDVDGLQIVGVPYRHATQNGALAAILRRLHLDRNRASILLTHAPDYPEIAEAAGVSLQLSGHTHLGQFVPWSWIARRIYRQFVYGLARIGTLQVFTSSGVGTWGPPLRLGSNPEIVVLEFE
jgi:uncharacterized protein